MAAQSASLLRGWVVVIAVVEPVSPLLGGTWAAFATGVFVMGALGNAGFGLFGCLTWGRRMGWKRRAAVREDE